ncbi:MAG: hypothetical protein LBI69_01365 [Puniceicoccales bacterium]|jgi:hypothetical protein|nr:hypothetical protein [Puniceicoccales bacterium]
MPEENTGINTSNLFIESAHGTTKTLDALYKYLVAVVKAQEEDVNKTVDEISQSGSTVDQGVLLKMQAMVQTMGIISGMATGILRAVGDALNKVTQNIR